MSQCNPTLFAGVTRELDALSARGLRRERRIIESPQASHLVVDGRRVVGFCSNDYLGLANDPRLVAAAREGAERYGVGAGASHMVVGHSVAHDALEQELARFVGLPRALLFSTGYMANMGVVTALMGRGAAVFSDRLNHASLNDAVLLSRADFKRYPHADLDALERLLKKTAAKQKLIATDAVFSMDGDIAAIGDLIRLCERYDAWLLLDDAHGFGVLGDSGGGILQHLSVGSPRIIYMATLGKAAGVFGAFVAAEPALIDLLVQRARPYIYTTALPPLLAHALLKSLEIIGSESWRREQLFARIQRFKQAAGTLPWKLLPSITAIHPLIVGSNAGVVALADALLKRGLLVAAIRPPTVPADTARLRITFSAAHTEDDLAQLVTALADVGRLDRSLQLQ